MEDISAIDKLLTKIIGLSGDPTLQSDLLTLLAQQAAELDNHAIQLLRTLRFSEASLACLHILWSSRRIPILQENQTQETEWAQLAKQFLQECDITQLRTGPLLHKFISVAEGVKTEAIYTKNFRQAIMPMLAAMKKFALTSEHLTPLHASVLQLCLLERNYAAAKEIVEQDFFEMNPADTLLQPTSFLLYCYYGGRLCIGLKQHQRALELFHLALVAPTLASNAITLIIYKHYFLLSLLDNGQVSELPRYASNCVIRLTQSVSMKPYQLLDDAYQHENKDGMEKVLQEYKQLFKEDQCTGLAKQVLSSLTRKKIKSSMQCYKTRSLKDIAQVAGLSDAEQAERVLQILAKEKRISVKISSRTQMVTFLEDIERDNCLKSTEQLQTMIKQAMELGVRMQEVEDNIELDPEYRSKVLQAKQHSKLDC